MGEGGGNIQTLSRDTCQTPANPNFPLPKPGLLCGSRGFHSELAASRPLFPIPSRLFTSQPAPGQPFPARVPAGPPRLPLKQAPAPISFLPRETTLAAPRCSGASPSPPRTSPARPPRSTCSPWASPSPPRGLGGAGPTPSTPPRSLR